ncbi:MAG: tetratricopeptide repeat protein [Bacteroidota bacterium]
MFGQRLQRLLKVFLLTLVVCWSSDCLANRPSIDSLQSILTESSTDSLKASIYRQLSEKYQYLNRDTSIYLAEEALQIAQEAQRKADIVLGYMRLGSIFIESGDYHRSLEYYNLAMPIATAAKDTVLLANLTNNTGLVYWELNQNDEAFLRFRQTYNWAIQLQDNELLSYALNNLGIISSESGRLEESQDYYKQLIALSTKMNDSEGLSLAKLNIGVNYLEMKLYHKALKCFEECLVELKNTTDHWGVALTHLNIGDTHLRLKKYQQSYEHLDWGLAICEQYGFNDLKIDLIKTKADCLLAMGKTAEALKLAELGLALVQTGCSKPQQFIDFYQTLSDVHEKAGNLPEAFSWMKRYVALKDSFFTIDREREIAQLEISFETQQKDAENSSLKEEKINQTLLIRQRTRIALITGVAVLFFMIITLQLYLARKKARSINLVLESMVKSRTDELEEINEELEQTNRELIHSNEELKRFAFIASHDLKEPLRNMGGFLSLIKKRLEVYDDDPDLMEYLQFVEKANYQMVDLVNNVLEYSRIGTKPKAWRELTQLQRIVEELETSMANVIRERGVQLMYNSLPNIYYSSSVVKIVLKNLIENAIRYNHSDPPIIKIDYEVIDNAFYLYVEDNGIGVAPEFQDKIFNMFVRLHNRDEYNGSGMGLAFCRKLLEKNGGTISLESEEGQGCRFTIVLPARIINSDEEALMLLRTSAAGQNAKPSDN